MSADFLTCYNWMLPNENGIPPYKKNPDGCPSGVVGPCFAIAGVNSGAWPKAFAAIEAIPQAERGAAVQTFYEANFWNQWIAQVVSDDVAKRVFDASVNMGSETACKLLQIAVNTRTRPQIATDGRWGPATVAAANACDPVALTGAFIAARVQHYRDIVAANPNDQKYLEGWIARASK